MINEYNSTFSGKEKAVEDKIQEIPISCIAEYVQRINKIRQAENGKPSIERIDQIKSNLEKAAEIMNCSGIEYQLDGAINISLYQNEFFRDHRDIDFSIFSKDLPKLIETLEKNGYALFRFAPNADEEAKKRGILMHELLRIKDIDISRVARQRLLFLKVKDNFEIDKENYDPIDIHCLDQDESGNVVKNNGNIIPGKYYENRIKYKLRSGRELFLSHPVILAYNKIFQGREHDLKDVEYMVQKGILVEKDLKEIDKFLARDEEKGWEGESKAIKKSRKWLKEKYFII